MAMLAAFLALGFIALALSATLRYAAKRSMKDSESLVEKIDAILPQTQCGQCGFAGCMPYANAIAKGEAEINQCPPGGERGIRELAELLGREFKPLSAAHGVEQPKSVALIDEKSCIGCTLCIQACPVDAIVGAAKQLHTVLSKQCTGCRLCVAPCPVDCISMLPTPESVDTDRAAANSARARYQFRLARLQREGEEKAAKLAARTLAGRQKTAAAQPDAKKPATTPDETAKKALIAAALARSRAQKDLAQPGNTSNLTPEQQAQITAIEERRSGMGETAKPQLTRDG